MSAVRRSTSIGRVVAAFIVATVIASTAFLGDPGAAKAGFSMGTRSWVSLGLHLAAPLRPLFDAVAGTEAINSGNDGRLTVLLLGSDARGGGISRTDTIMIMSLKGNQINVASIPRDTRAIPNPAGGTFKGKINSLARQMGLASFEYVIEKLLNIEIDYYALIKFDAFNDLVEQVEPVSINTQQVKDKRFWDDPKLPKGLYVPAMTNYQLYAWQPSYLASNGLCNGLWITKGTSLSQYWCHRALDYVRSRKGGSDFQRARRQQSFVGAAINAVSSGEIGALVSTANAQAGAGGLMTNIPFNSSAFALFDTLSGAYLGNQVVFSPKAYATHIPGTTAYQLKLSAVRAWTAIYMK